MKSFSEVLFEVIDDTLREVFGKKASELIYTLVEKHVSLKREEIAEKTEAFHAYLEKLLGSERAQIIQTTGLKRLCLKLRREYEEVESISWFSMNSMKLSSTSCFPFQSKMAQFATDHLRHVRCRLNK